MFALLVIVFLVVFIIIVNENHRKYIKKGQDIKKKNVNINLNSEQLVVTKVDLTQNTFENNIKIIVNKVANIVVDAPLFEGTYIWTYIEPTLTNTSIQLLDKSLEVPVFFEMCIQLMKKFIPSIIIVTPKNLHKYVKDFPIKMHHKSHIPMRKRVDLLHAYLLEKYGGLCISPGTIIHNPSMLQSLVNKSDTNEIVTVGSSPRVMNGLSNKKYPNTYIIGSKPNSKLIHEYKRHFLKSIKKKQISSSYDILSKLLIKRDPSQFHLGIEYDGTHNSNMRLITIKEYLGRYPIDYLDPEKLYVISVPYEILLRDTEHRWFLELSKQKYKMLNTEMTRKLNTALKE
jgi:hypothetical protein